MKTTGKKILALFLVVLMTFSAFPATVLSDTGISAEAATISSVKLNNHKMTICNNICPYLIASVTPSNANTSGLKWTSSNTEVAIIESGNTVCPVGFGKTIIKVSTPDGKYYDTCELTVNASFVITSDTGMLNGIKVGDAIKYYIYLYNSEGKRLPIKNSNIECPQSRVTILKKEIKSDCVELTLKGKSAGSCIISCSSDDPIAYNDFYVNVFNADKEYKNTSVPVINNKLKTNFSQAGMTVDNFKQSFDKSKNEYSVSMDIYNSSGANGAVVVYDKNGNIKNQVIVKNMDHFPSDFISFLGVLFKGATSIFSGDNYNYRFSLEAAKTSVSVKVPKDGYITISDDIFSCSTAGAYNFAALIMDGALFCIKQLDSTVTSAKPSTKDMVKALEKEIPDFTKLFKDFASSYLKEVPKSTSLTYIKSDIDASYNLFERICNASGKDMTDVILKSLKKVGVSAAKTTVTKKVLINRLKKGVEIKEGTLKVAKALYKAGDIVDFINRVLYTLVFDAHSGMTLIRFDSSNSPMQVCNLCYSDVGKDYVVLNWNKVPTKGVKYLVYVTAGKSSFSTVLNTSTPSIKVSSLSPNTTYTFSVSATIGNNSGKKSPALTVKTLGSSPSVSQPTVSTSSYYGGYKVTLKSATSGATIYYTTNGSTPTTSSTKYSSPFKITSTKIIKAIAVKSGYNNSSVMTTRVSVGTAATPKISASYGGKQTTVKMSSSTSGAIIYYTLDGSTPTTSSKKYTGTIYLTSNATIKAIAYKTGMKTSGVQTLKTAAVKPAAPSPYISGSNVVGTNAIVNVRWNEVDYAGNYVLTLYDNDGNVAKDASNKSIIINTDSKGTSIDLKKYSINPGKYYFVVYAENFVGRSSDSSKVYFEVKPDVTIKFISDDTVVKEAVIPYGSSVSAPKDPEKTGHDFKGWQGFTESMTAFSNLTFIAEFEKKVYNVNFIYADKTKKYEDSHIQQVKYGEEAILPTDVYLTNSDYKVSGWYVEYEDNSFVGKFDVNFVDGNMSVKPILDLKDPTLPLTIDDKSLKVEWNSGVNDYTFNLKLENGTNQVQTGATIIAVLKTVNGKVVETATQDIGTITARGSKTYSITINSTQSASQAEVYVVKYSDGITGKAFSTSKSTSVSSADNKVYGAWSAWSEVRPSEEDDRIIEKVVQKATRTKQTTSSTNSSLSGWISNGSTTSYGNWGNWSSWSLTSQSSSDTKDVEKRTVHYYMHYCDGKGNKGNIAPSKKYSAAKYGPHEIYSTTKYTNDRYSSSTGYYIADGHAKCAKGCTSYYYMGTKTQYRYRTRTKTITYNYYKWTDYSEWTSTDIAIASIPSNTDTTKYRVAYRFRDLDDSGNSSITSGEDNSGTLLNTFVNKLPTDVDYSGKSATAIVFKTRNSDAIGKQIVAIKQIEIGSGNTYSFSFIPKEELSDSTGDFKIQICVAGVETSFISEIISVPPKQYRVTFEYKETDGTVKSVVRTVNEGESAVPPSIPEITGYEFVRWNKNFTNVNSDITVSATYAQEKYTVVYVDWVNSNIIETKQFEYGSELTLPAVTLSSKGKVFKGWSYKAGYVVKDNLVVEAVYDAVKYTVSFVDATGEVINTQKIPYGGSAELPEGPARDGYTFNGWSTDEKWWDVTKDMEVTPIYALKNSGVSVSLSETDYIYSGKTIKPEVYVENADGYSVDPEDYTVSYSNKSSKSTGEYTVTVKLADEYKSTQTLTYTISPKAVTGVKVSSSSKKSAKITYSKVTGASGYEIYFSTKKTSGFKKLVTTTKTSYTYSKLTSGKTYYFKVRAYTKASDGTRIYGAWSSVASKRIR